MNTAKKWQGQLQIIVDKRGAFQSQDQADVSVIQCSDDRFETRRVVLVEGATHYHFLHSGIA